jgi:NTP pyrophosphatase (non-canonical NTP hydrolase)
VDERLQRLSELIAVVERLRGPEGCPWDREQTHATLRSTLLEEAYEVLAAIDGGAVDELRDELGDVLLQVLMHAEIARQAGEFELGDVADSVRAKLVRRHPHVFGDVTVSGADEVKRNWDEIKREEKRALAERQGRPVAGQVGPPGRPLPPFLTAPFRQPALALAAQSQRRAARARVLTNWRTSTGDTGSGESAGPGEDIGRDCSRLSWRPARRALTRRRSYVPPRAVTATSCAPGNVRNFWVSFIDSVMLLTLCDVHWSHVNGLVS